MPYTPQPSPSTENAVTSNVAILHHLMIQLFVKQVNHSDCAGKDTSRIFSNNSIFFFRITDPTTKKYGLLIYEGEDIADIKEALPDPLPEEGNDVYKVLI